MSVSTSKDVFIDQLLDLSSLEEQVVATLPGLTRRARNGDLKALLADHGIESRRHLHEVGGIFSKLRIDPTNDVCKAMQGLIEGGDRHIGEAANPVARDLLLIAHCSRIAHYEIAAYGFASAIARHADLVTEAGLLGEILAEEQAFLRALAMIGAGQFGIHLGGAG